MVTHTSDRDNRVADGKLHLTVSLYVAQERMRALLGAGWSLPRRRALREAFHSSSALAETIEPLFDDIADRRRDREVDDFLLDVAGPDIYDVITIHLPQEIGWATEGNRFVAALPVAPVFSAGVRAFWFVHSNGALSYHLSFAIPYRHHYADYYALSALQKLVHPTEQTEYLREVTDVRTARGEDFTFWGFIREAFNTHARDLLSQCALAQPLAGGRAARTDALADLADPFARLILDEADQAGRSLPEKVRSLILLEDPHLFTILGPDARELLSDYESRVPDETGPGDQPIRLDPAFFATIPPARFEYYFLSGFFQNIIDFLCQDTSEVRDGTDPIYPTGEAGEAESFFILYANPNTIFEVVSRSRSLEAGYAKIGTCPYLLLVHIMTLHNEALVRGLEHEVARLFDELDIEDGQTSITGDLEKLNTFCDTFYTYRLKVFKDVKRHLYRNVLRYDTEQAFYNAIQKVRGIEGRLATWDAMLADLADSIADVQARLTRQQDRRLNRIVMAVTAFSALQVCFQSADAIGKLFYDSKGEPMGMADAMASWTVSDAMNAVFLALAAVATAWVGWMVVRTRGLW